MPDIVISEILFNPLPQGTDYIEIYNRSNQTINLAGWRLANRNTAGLVSSVKTLPAQAGSISPGEYRVLTEEPVLLRQTYQVRDVTTLVPLSTLPSYPDAAGTVILLDPLNNVVDELRYDEKWHFALLQKAEGVALERIDVNKPTQDAANWHSAASDAGYGTPGYKNSQHSNYTTSEGIITIQPRLFSPDNDGRDDYALIQYKFPDQGYVCSLTIFNVNGIPVKYIARNALCGISGYYKWDGLNERGDRSGIGVYILLAEVFNLRGISNKYKYTVVLAGSF